MPEIKLNKTVVREAVLRAVTDANKEERTAEFVISTEAPDTWGTVFKIAGWKLDRYEKNPIVCYAHRSWSENPDAIIGTSEVFVEGEQLIGRVRFESADINPLAEKVFQKVLAGTLRMASIGANPIRGHWGDEKLGEDKDIIYFDEQELVEWSIVPLGSNPEALKRSADALEEIRAEMVKDIEVTGDSAAPTIKRSVRERQLIINQNRSR